MVLFSAQNLRFEGQNYRLSFLLSDQILFVRFTFIFQPNFKKSTFGSDSLNVAQVIDWQDLNLED